jgi:hypothetical protein
MGRGNQWSASHLYKQKKKGSWEVCVCVCVHVKEEDLRIEGNFTHLHLIDASLVNPIPMNPLL